MAFYDVYMCNKSFVYKLIFPAFSPMKYVSDAVGYHSQPVLNSVTYLAFVLELPCTS